MPERHLRSCPPPAPDSPVSVGESGLPGAAAVDPKDDVMLFVGRVLPPLQKELESAGWRLHAEADGRQLWTRDRIAAARAALGRTGGGEPHGLDVA
jgi:hypothetical protein